MERAGFVTVTGTTMFALPGTRYLNGLTVPTVALIAWFTGTELALGVDPMSAVLLTLSFIMAIITYGTGRASLLSGIVHLILLAVWLFLIVVPCARRATPRANSGVRSTKVAQ